MSERGEVVVRPVAPEDRARWEQLFLAYGNFYQTTFTPKILEGVWGWLMSEEHPLRCFVAAHNDTLTGFAHIRQQPDTFRAGPSWFLDDLYTDEEARGHGVATALIAAVTDYASAKGGGTIRWITEANNTTAQRLYDTLAERSTWVVYQNEVPKGER